MDAAILLDATVLLEALVQEKRMYSLLNEVMDLSVQLAQAADRDDQISLNILMGMRAEVVEKLQTIRRALEEQRDSLEPIQRARFAELLNGEPAELDAEQPLAAQVATNCRLHARVLECDEGVSRKLAKGNSIYQ